MTLSKKITFLPMKEVVLAPPEDATLGELAARLGLPLDQSCGGVGRCGKCRVIVRKARSMPNEIERKMLTPEELMAGYRLACQCPLEDGLVVLLPCAEKGEMQILDGEAELFIIKGRDPLVRKRATRLTMPEVDDDITSLGEIVLEDLGLKNTISLNLLKEMGSLFLNHELATMVFTETDLIAIERGDTSHSLYGVAIDIGTTSLVVWLVDLNTGIVIDRCLEVNPQISFGADVLSRISYLQKHPKGLETLRNAILVSLNEMIANIASCNNLPEEEIYAAVIVGNTCMEHIALGIDPLTIGRSPFIPVSRFFPMLDASSLGLAVNPEGRVLVMPCISGYVGGDIAAGVMASGMFKDEKITLLIDIGTNGEIVLGNKEFLIACSAAAGPAFEGGQISCGMCAKEGAIEKVRFGDGNIELEVIGKCDPLGICGSGLIDLIAEMLRHGLIDESGKLNESGSKDLGYRIFRDESGILGFRFCNLSPIEGTGLAITQRDVRQVQLAKAAIATGIEVLLEKTCISMEDIDRVIVAGAFGNYLNSENAMTIGILPKVPLEKIHYIGNSAIRGAYCALMSQDALQEVNAIVDRTKVVELSTLKDFTNIFLKNLVFKID